MLAFYFHEICSWLLLSDIIDKINKKSLGENAFFLAKNTFALMNSICSIRNIWTIYGQKLSKINYP